MSARRLRVVQWATGNIGSRALREVIRHHALDLVGVLVFDPVKDGTDAGVLAGIDPVGLAATTDRAAITALDADCVLHMPRVFELDDIVALLERGTNIVSTRGELMGGGRRLGDDGRARVVDACARGNASAYATGSSPGFITDALPYALLSLQRRVDLIEINEYANLSQRDSPHLLFQQMGFGQPPDTLNPARAAYLLEEFRPALEELAIAAGRPPDEWTAVGEIAVARETTTLLAGELPAGTVGAQRTTIAGRRAGEDVVKFVANWYCTPDVDPAWDLHPTGWRVRVHGDAPMAVELPFPVPLEELKHYTPGYTANRPVNAIPYVCAARPGILSTMDLPPVTPAGPAQ